MWQGRQHATLAAEGRCGMLKKRVAILIACVVLGLIVLGRVGDAVVDWLWFSSIGYAGVFWTIFTPGIVVFLAVLAASAGAFWLSGWLALRFAGGPAVWPPRAAPSWPLQRQGPTIPLQLIGYASSHVPWRLLVAGMAVLLGLLTAVLELSNWELVLRFLYQVPYGESDPVFGKDIGFYLFSLPPHVARKNLLMLLVLFSTLVAGAVYWAHGDIDLDKPPRRLSAAALAHGSALLCLFFVVKASSYGLDR